MNNESLIKTQQWMQAPAALPQLPAGSEYTADPQSGSVLDYWKILRRRKLALSVFGVAGLAAGLAIGFCQKPMYRATAALEIQDNKDDVFTPKTAASPTGSAPDVLANIQTQMRILQSKGLLDRTLNRVEKSSDGRAAIGHPAASFLLRLLPGRHAKPDRQALLDILAKQLKVSQSGQTRIVEISFEAGNPVEAARFTNTLTSEFIAENLESRLELNRNTTDWLTSQVDELRSKLRASETALQTYARQRGLLYTNDNQSISEEKLRQMQTELSKVQADRVDKQSRAEVAHSSTAQTVPDVLNDGNLRAMETTLADLQRQEADLRVVFKPDYSKTKRVQAEIESLQASIAAKRTEIIHRVDHELQESERREQLLSAAYARQMRSVTDDSEKSIQYDMLKHDVDTNRQIYQVMLQRVKESSISSAIKATNVRVLDAAKPPERPYKPNLPINSGAGLICGLMLGAAVILVRARTNPSVQQPGDAGMLLGVPELGVIPAALAENSSALADSFRSVLASILFAGARQRQQVLVVTSANPSEGKTTTVTNLGATLANMNRKVLLIDGDIRSPRLHSIFGLDNSVGLTNVLQQIARQEVPKIQTAIRPTAIPNLHVLTSGPSVEAGADLLFSASMPALIARYREEYGMVLIDTPPMLLMPDARFLGRVADGVVLIARAGRTGRDAIQAACRRFLEDRTPILGVVLNDWNAKVSGYDYYAKYRDSAAGQPGVVVNAARN